MTTHMSPPAAPVFAAPFRIEHFTLAEGQNRFTPAARLVLTPSLRASGLIAQLADEEARTLLALLSFLSANGHIQPSIFEMAEVLGVSEDRARSRLNRLAASSWRGNDLVRMLPRETGLTAYVPTHALVDQQEAPKELSPGELIPLELPPAADGTEETPTIRERIIANSRATYARPREVVERIVAAQLGVPVEEETDSPEGEARRELRALGVDRETIQSLVERFPVSRILDQARWLPLRGDIRNSARYVVAAIEKGFEAPPQIRLEQELLELEGQGKLPQAQEKSGEEVA